MKYVLAVILFILMPLSVSAAVLSVTTDPKEIGIGNVAQITVSVSSETSVNTFSGTLLYPKDLLEPLLISDGNSIVPLWIKRPEDASGSISFAGVTPGGFVGENGKIFSVIFRAKTAGKAAFTLTDSHVLLSDGSGTEASTTQTSVALSISASPGNTYVIEQDATPPQPFEINVQSGPDGKKYAIFAAVDKGSGVKRYEASESRFSSNKTVWLPAESPYLLPDQELTSDIYIRAVDNMGNVRTEELLRENILRKNEEAGVIALAVLLGLMGGYLLLRPKRNKIIPV